MPNQFSLTPYSSGGFQITSSSATVPLMVVRGSEYAARLYLDGFNFLYNNSASFRGLLNQHVAVGGGIQFFAVQGRWELTPFDYRRRTRRNTGTVTYEPGQQAGAADWYGRLVGNGAYIDNPNSPFDMNVVLTAEHFSVLRGGGDDYHKRQFATAIAHELYHPFGGAHLWNIEGNPSHPGGKRGWFPESKQQVRMDSTTTFHYQILAELGGGIWRAPLIASI